MYKSTRSKANFVTSMEAIINGIAADGGLYVPNIIPKLNTSIESLLEFNYVELSHYIIKQFLNDFDDKELLDCIKKAYDEKFDTPEILNLVKKQGVYFLELYHGPTLAFKDMALSLLPHLLKNSLERGNFKKEVVILTATSGDTGKAALEGFGGVEGIKIITFYPEGGVSDTQKMQMLTSEGDNTFVVAVNGNFDDTQNEVKGIFNDKVFNEKLMRNNYILSSANSINIGRLIPQIVYYFYSYIKLLKSKDICLNESINFVVPTGNFGNILAGYYAKKMGLPINKLICASNENNVLYHFLQDGIYDRNRPFFMTNSPSMDILISSNLERLLYEVSGKDESVVKGLMKDLAEKGIYEISNSMKSELADFYGGYSLEADTDNTIKEVFSNSHYLIDPHTAVAYSVYKKYLNKTKDSKKTVILSTASPFKFSKSVCTALGINVTGLDDFELMDTLSKVSGIKVPKKLSELKTKKILHNNSCDKHEMKFEIEKLLKV